MSNPSPFEGLPETTAKDLSKQAFPSAAIEPPSIERTMVGNPSALPPPPDSQPPTGTFLQVAASADSITHQIITSKDISVPPDYFVLGELGRGGMGVVYKARHKRLNRVVALKMILSGSHASHDEHLRFIAEAEAVAALSHPNIVQIFESGTHEGLPYFTLEYVSGGSLGALVKDHPLEGREAARIVEQIALGMDYAHQQGIVHRDLKPENILLSSEFGVRSSESKTPDSKATSASGSSVNSELRTPNSALPKITDFGLAKKVEGGSGLTATGAVMGTPSFMAPEQAKGDLKLVGPLSDVYAVGAILYRLIAGRPPFQAATVMETVMQVLNQEPVPPTQFSAKIPRDLETICLKCLQKDPQKRYPSCGELAADLRRFLVGEPILARPVGRVERFVRWCRRNPSEAILLTSIGIVLVAATILSTTLSIRASRNESEAIKLAKLAQDHENDALAAMDEVKASNRKTENLFYATRINLAYRDWLGGDSKRANRNLDECPDELRGWEWHFLRSLESVQSVELRGHEESVYQGIFFLGGKQAMTIGKAGTMRYWDTQLGTQFDQGPQGVQMIAAAPDQKKYAGVKDELIFVGDLETGRKYFEYRLWDAPAATVQFVLNGKKIATVSDGGKVRIHDAETGKQDFESSYSLVLEGRNPLRTLIGQIGGNQFAFSPDGKRVAYGSRDGHVRVTDVATGELLLDGTDHYGLVERVVYHPTREVIASAGQDGIIRLWDLSTKRICHELKGHANYVHALAFSPDGTRLLSGGKDQTLRLWGWETEDNKMVLRGHTGDILSATFDATGAFAITGSADATARVWDLRERVYTSPEARKMFEQRRGRNFSLIGSQDHLKFFGHGSPAVRLALSPNGKRAATSCLGPIGVSKVVVWNLETRQEVQKLPLVKSMLYSMAFSPDGKYLLVAGSGGGTPDPGELHLFDAATWEQKWEWKGPLSIELAPVFSPDGSRLVGTSQIYGSGQNYLFAWDATNGNELYRKPLEEVITRGCFTPDGGSFLFSGIRSGTLYLHDVASGERQQQWMTSIPPVLDVACSKKGVIAVAGGRGHIDLIDLARREKLRSLEGHADGTLGVAFSPEGDRLFSCGGDLAARLWQVETGYELVTFRDHQSIIQHLAWAADGAKVGTIALDGALRIWEAPSRAAPPDTKEWETLHRDDFTAALEKQWQPLDEAIWVNRDRKAVGRLVARTYQNRTFGYAQLRLMGVQVPRTFEAKVKFKTPQPLSVGLALTDPRTKRTFSATVNESNEPHGRPSTYVQQVSYLDNTLRLVPIDHWQKYTLAASQQHELRLLRQDGVLRLFVDGQEQFMEPVSLIDLPLLTLQGGGTEAGSEIEFSDFELRAPREAIREQSLRTRVVSLFDELGFRDGVRDALKDDATLTKEDRETIEQVLRGLVEDPWKMRDRVEVRGINANLPQEQIPILLKQAEFLVKLDPNEWQFVVGFGMAQYRAGQFPEAAVTFQRAAELHAADKGSPLPSHYGYLALSLDRAGRKDEARAAYRKMADLLEWSDHWKTDDWQKERCEEARPLYEFKDAEEVAKIKSLLTRTEQDGWVGHKLPEYLAAFDRSFMLRVQTREESSPADFELDFDTVIAIRKVQFASPVGAEVWMDFDEIEVKLDGDKAQLRARETVHFGAGFQVFRVQCDLAKREGGWKFIRSKSWMIAERMEGVVVNRDEAWWKAQHATLDRLKTGSDHVQTAKQFKTMLDYKGLVEFADRLPGEEVDSDLWSLKGEALFELGRLPESWASFRSAIRANPARELPWYLSPVKRQFPLDNAFGLTAAWLPGGAQLVGGGNDGIVRIWNVQTGKETYAFPKEQFAAMGVDVSSDGELLAVGLQNGHIQVWNLKTNAAVTRCIGHTKGVYRVAFDPAGKRFVSSSLDGTARIWDARTGQVLQVLTGHEDEVLAAAFSPDGTRVATASHDRTARIWDATAGKELAKFTGHTSLVKRVVWSADGKRLFTAGADSTARVWDVDTQKEIRKLTGHNASLDALDLSPDGTTLATTDISGSVRLWDAKNYRLLRTHYRFNGAIYSAKFSPDSRYLATAGRDGVIVYALQEFPSLEEKKTP